MRYLTATIVLCLFLGCVASDPVQNLIVEQKLIGTWVLYDTLIRGESTRTENDNESFFISFESDNSVQLSSSSEESQKEIKKALDAVSIKYVVNGDELQLLAFREKGGPFRAISNFTLKHNLLILRSIKLKDDTIGTIDFKSIYPDAGNMAFVLRRSADKS